jgi:malate/lactate dehydrogenase
MHIILTGATGTIGYPVLQLCLASPKVTRLSILSRRPFDLPSGDNVDTKKAQIILHEDYTNYPVELADQLKGAEACIWAQGVSQKDVPKE